MTRVLVTYAGSDGSMEEIARTIGRTLRGADIIADVLHVTEVADVGPYAAVVLGSAVSGAAWHDEAVEFIRCHREALRVRDVWLFQNSPREGSTEEGPIPLPSELIGVTEDIGAHPHITFHATPFQHPSEVPGGTGTPTGAFAVCGDFRNFDGIRIWAQCVRLELESVRLTA